jgi:hypothetical protein
LNLRREELLQTLDSKPFPNTPVFKKCPKTVRDQGAASWVNHADSQTGQEVLK